jgi:hypothetical protein
VHAWVPCISEHEDVAGLNLPAVEAARNLRDLRALEDVGASEIEELAFAGLLIRHVAPDHVKLDIDAPVLSSAMQLLGQMPPPLLGISLLVRFDG